MRTETKVRRGGLRKQKRENRSETMKARGVSGGMVAAVVLGARAAEGLIFNPPHCALPGLQVPLFGQQLKNRRAKPISICCLQVGAGLGTVAGAFGGVAAAGDHSSSVTGIED